MDLDLPKKILEFLYHHYGASPTEFLSTDEVAKSMGIPVTEAQAGLIYLKEKFWIDCYTIENEWHQRINISGIDELQKNFITSNNTQNNIDDKLNKIESKIKEAKLEKERRKEVAEQKYFGAFIEIIDLQRDIIKQKDQNTKEITELQSRISKLEKLFSNPHEQLISNVYEPCYNQMKNLYDDREFITTIPANPWTKVSNRWKLKTEPEIRQLFENYSKELKTWHKMWVDFGNKFQTNRGKIGEIVKAEFKELNMLDQNDNIAFAEGAISSADWVHNCQDVIFNENITNEEELYQILKTDSDRRWREPYTSSYDKWKKETPEIYSKILKIIPKMVQTLNAKYSYQEMDEQRMILKNRIEEITIALEKKL